MIWCTDTQTREGVAPFSFPNGSADSCCEGLYGALPPREVSLQLVEQPLVALPLALADQVERSVVGVISSGEL